MQPGDGQKPVAQLGGEAAILERLPEAIATFSYDNKKAACSLTWRAAKNKTGCSASARQDMSR